jgi:transposase
MTLADQAAIPVHDGQVTSGRPGKPKRRAFTAAYKAKLLAEFDALPENSTERGALLRKERLWHSHIEDWRRQRDAARSASPSATCTRSSATRTSAPCKW